MGKKLRLRHFPLPEGRFLLVFDNVSDDSMHPDNWKRIGEYSRENIPGRGAPFPAVGKCDHCHGTGRSV